MRASTFIGFLGLIAIVGAAAVSHVARQENRGSAYRVIDGDTLALGGERIRLLRIDAPEMPTSPRHCERVHCPTGDPYAARDALQWAITRGTVQCAGSRRDIYGRRLAECFVTGTNGTTVNVNDYLLSTGLVERYRGRP